MPFARHSLLGLGVLLLGCGSAPAGPGDIVLITVDTLRPDHLSLYGYARPTSPNLDRAFASGLVFERAYATETSTSPSVASLLTGRLPQEHGVRLFYQLLSRDQKVVTELLPQAYQTAAVVSNIVLTDEAMGLASRFDHYDDFVDEREGRRQIYERRAERTTDAALAWLDGEADPERPVFLWVHYIDPHGPYRPPASWPRRFRHEGKVPVEPRRILSFQRDPSLDDALSYVDAYDEEIGYADREVGRLLAGLSARRPLGEALLIFTADHGESMLEHERWFTHGYHVYEELVRVPLMMRGPGIDAGRRPEPVSLIDIVPTILDFAGVEPPAGLAGRSALRDAGNDPERWVYAEASGRGHQWRAAIGSERKWMAQVLPGNGSIAARRLYDLRSDPGERKARPWTPDEDPAGLGALIAADPDPGGLPQHFADGIRIDAPKVRPGLDAEARERLRKLGYVDETD